MIKATRLQAVALALKSGGTAVMVQDGDGWNELQKFKCIAPPSLEGVAIIATREPGSGLAAHFGGIFNLSGGETWRVMMSSPELADQLVEVPDGSASAGVP